MEALEEHDQKYILAKNILKNAESSQHNPEVRFIDHFIMACQKPGDIWEARIETKWMCKVAFHIMKALDYAFSKDRISRSTLVKHTWHVLPGSKGWSWKWDLKSPTDPSQQSIWLPERMKELAGQNFVTGGK
jgi:hypothetical protein